MDAPYSVPLDRDLSRGMLQRPSHCSDHEN
jgi:hypothetical protein